MTTRVVRIKRQNGKIIQDCDVYIGRAINMGGWRLSQSKWYNPFSVKEYGREECLRKYREYILSRPDLLSSLSELEGKTLGCWCKPDKCHGDVLVELLNEKTTLDPKERPIDVLEELRNLKNKTNAILAEIETLIEIATKLS